MNCALLFAGLWAQAVFEADLDRFTQLIQRGSFKEVLPQLESYTLSHPDSAKAAYQLGFVYYRLHRIAPSVQALSKSLAMDPKNADAHRILGYDLTMLARLNLAETEFRRATELQPELAENHYALGRVLYESGSYAASVVELEKAVRLDPSSAKAHQSLGLSYEAVNDIAHAQEHLSLAVKLNDNETLPSEWPYINYSAFRNRRGDYEAALLLAGKAIAIAPRSDAAHFQAAKAYRGLEQWRPCIAELKTAIDIAPENPEFFYTLAIAYRRLGEPEKANTSLEQYERLKK